MENEEEGREPTEETTPTEQIEPVKKSGFFKSVIIVLLVLVVLAAGALAGYTWLRSSPQVRHISKDAIAVAMIDLPALMQKADVQQIKKNSIDDNLREALQDLNMEALLDKPRSTGLLTLKPAYFFIDYDAKSENFSGYYVMPIANGDKLAKFIKGITPPGDEDIEVEHKGTKYFVENEGVVCSWEKNSLILGMSFSDKSEGLLKRVTAYLDQSKAQSISGNRQFKREQSKGHDIMLWVNTDAIASIADKGFQKAKPRVQELIAQRREYNKQWAAYNTAKEAFDSYYGDFSNNFYDYYDYGFSTPSFDMQPPDIAYPKGANIFETILLESSSNLDSTDSKPIDDIIAQISQLKGTSVTIYADFCRGRLVSGFKTTLSPTLIKKYQGIYKNIAGTKNLAKFLPRDRLIGTASYRFNWDEMWKASGKQMMDWMDKTIPDRAAVYDTSNVAEKDSSKRFTKHFYNLCDGSLLATMNLGTGKHKDVFFTVAGSIKKNTGIQSILKEMDKDGSYEKSGKAYKSASGEDAFLLEEGVIIWTSNYSQYKKCDLGLGAKDLNKVKSTPAGVFFDVAQMLDLVGDDINDDDISDILAQITNVSVTSKHHNGVPDEYVINVKMKEKGKNALKVLWETFTDKVDVFENMNKSLKEEKESRKKGSVPADTTVVVEPGYGGYDTPVDTTMAY